MKKLLVTLSLLLTTSPAIAEGFLLLPPQPINPRDCAQTLYPQRCLEEQALFWCHQSGYPDRASCVAWLQAECTAHPGSAACRGLAALGGGASDSVPIDIEERFGSPSIRFDYHDPFASFAAESAGIVFVDEAEGEIWFEFAPVGQSDGENEFYIGGISYFTTASSLSVVFLSDD